MIHLLQTSHFIMRFFKNILTPVAGVDFLAATAHAQHVLLEAQQFATVTVIVTDAEGASASNSFVIGVAPLTTSLVATGSVWKFNDSGANLGTAWRSTSFNETAWLSGPSMLGFGDANGLLPGTLIASNRQITTYFRKAFVASAGLDATNLGLRIQRDDAAVVYLNGLEIWRDTNFTSGTIAFNTLASVSLGGAAERESVAWRSCAQAGGRQCFDQSNIEQNHDVTSPIENQKASGGLDVVRAFRQCIFVRADFAASGACCC